MTDADSTVPAHWPTRQIAWARRGHDAVLGTIRPPDPVEEQFPVRTPATEACGHSQGRALAAAAASDATDIEHRDG